MQDSTTPKLTDAGRAQIRRMRVVFLPLRILFVLLLVTQPAGGPVTAWNVVTLRPFLILLALMVISERTGITMDPSTRNRDRATKWLLVVAMFGPLMLGVWQAATGAVVVGEMLLLMQGVGAALWIAGEGVRRWAMATLGRFFTDTVRIFQDHRLIVEGPYKHVRHPSYAGLLLVMLGAPMTTGSLLATVISAVAGGAALAWRVSVEERALGEAFGAEYASYRAVTPALFPWPKPAGKV